MRAWLPALSTNIWTLSMSLENQDSPMISSMSLFITTTKSKPMQRSSRWQSSKTWICFINWTSWVTTYNSSYLISKRVWGAFMKAKRTNSSSCSNNRIDRFRLRKKPMMSKKRKGSISPATSRVKRKGSYSCIVSNCPKCSIWSMYIWITFTSVRWMSRSVRKCSRATTSNATST